MCFRKSFNIKQLFYVSLASTKICKKHMTRTQIIDVTTTKDVLPQLRKENMTHMNIIDVS